jgi:tetratricopeptide (TPR) repeat protein
MGKTRLVTDFARSRGATLVVGARPGDERVVYATASRLLRQLPRSALDALAPGVRAELAQLLPELGPAAGWGSDAQRTRFFNAVTVLLDSPALALEGVVFDDLHFADAASIELCQYVAAQSSRRWLFAGREAELGPAAQALLAALGDGLAPVDLPPLTLAQAAELVESLALDGVDAAALAAPLLQHTGGNPLYMLETLKAWLTQEGIEGALGPAARLPAVRSVSALIERRIGRLSPAAVQLARCAAVATPDFSIELAARVLGVRTLDLADPWAELEAAQVLRDGAFAHDLIYESALASVPAPVARQLHAEIAAFLDAHQGEPARIAHHWLEAGVEARALEALRAAAEAARRAMRKREEIELRDRACAIAERLGRLDDAFDEALVHFEAVMTADRTQVGETLFARLDRLARAPVQRLRSLLAQADFLMSSGRFGEAAPRAEAAADLARGLGDVVREIEALRCAAACASFGGDTQRAVRLLRPALPRVLEQLDDGNDRIGYFGDLACCLDNADQPQEAAEFHRRGLELALQLNRLDLAAVIGGNYSYSLKAAGLVAQAFEQALQAQRYAQTFDDARGAAYHLDVVMLALLRDLGRYDQALRAGEVALQSMAQNPSRAPVVHGHLAWLWLQLGQPARAGQALAAARAETVAPHLRARVTQLEGRLRAALGQKTGAADAFRQAHEEAPATGRVLMQSLIALDHASTLVPESALAQCEAVLQRCASLGYDGAVLTARLRAAEHALRAGDAARSHGHVRAVLAAPSQVVADDIDPAVRWLVAARVLDAVGDTPARDDVLRQGMAWLQHTATQHVPAEFRDGFMERNAVHRELRAMAARQASA